MIVKWNRKPRGFQREAIPCLLLTCCVSNILCIILLAQIIGSSKSLMPQKFDDAIRSATLLIERTLSLANSQHYSTICENAANSLVNAFCLHSI